MTPFFFPRLSLKAHTTEASGAWLGGQPAGSNQQALQSQRREVGHKGELCLSAFKALVCWEQNRRTKGEP